MTFDHPLLRRLHALASAYPDVEQGGACVKASYKVRNKGFMYLGEKPGEVSIMLKLDESAAAAEALGKALGGEHSLVVGKAGWTTLKSGTDFGLPEEHIEVWMQESYTLQAPKRRR